MFSFHFSYRIHFCHTLNNLTLWSEFQERIEFQEKKQKTKNYHLNKLYINQKSVLRLWQWCIHHLHAQSVSIDSFIISSRCHWHERSQRLPTHLGIQTVQINLHWLSADKVSFFEMREIAVLQNSLSEMSLDTLAQKVG